MTREAAQRCALALAIVCGVAALLGAADAMAQARNPFSVGISEGGGAATGLTGWILAKQNEFERLLSGAVRAVKSDGHAMWALAGVSFAYGVFHAAGPGHGKAVVASYMLANERALRRGLIISFMAAVLQGVVAIAIVGVLALALNATAQKMKDAASFVELASYAGIAALGLYLVVTKGRGLWAAVFAPKAAAAPAVAGDGGRFACEVCEADAAAVACNDPHGLALPGHMHDVNCGHFHAPDPRTLGDNFSWGSAIATVFAAGSRPCSGAILVLVFALAQGVFLAGVGATVAMSLGTAITTGALAAMAVFAKQIALRFIGGTGTRGALIGRAFEFIAACAVFFLGTALLLGSSTGGG